MSRTRLVAALVVICTGSWSLNDVTAQRFYSGSGYSDAQYTGANSIDSNGRTVNAEGRAVDRYGHVIDDYGRLSTSNRVPSSVAGTTYYPATSYSSSGYYYPGGYSGLGYTNGLGYSVGLGGYSGGYYATGGRFSSAPGVIGGGTYIAPPRTVVVGGVYNSRTVMNNSTRGGVVEYTNNGNGYIYSPGTSYQSVISSGPSIFPSISVVQPSQPASLIETRPTQTVSKTFSGSRNARPSSIRSPDNRGNITLMFPKDSSIPMSYVLNGTVYSIKPGYSQTFLDDRPWTIEFLRGGSGSLPMRYELKAGTYQFVADENGWDLKAVPLVTGSQPSATGSQMAPLPPVPPEPTPISTVTPDIVPAPVPSPDL